MFFLNSIFLSHVNADTWLLYFLSMPVLALILVFLTKVILAKFAPNKFEINTFIRYVLVWILYFILIIGIASIIIGRM